MTDNRFVASKRDIILFSIISAFASIILIFPYFDPSDFSYYLIKITVILFLFLPQILAIIINKKIERSNIKNDKTLKITKILFNIFTCINFAFWSFVVYISYIFDMPSKH